MLHTHPPIKQKDLGSVPCVLTKTVNYNTSGIGSGVNWFQVRATEAKPVLVEFFAEVVTAFNAVTTNVLTLGRSSDSGFDDILTTGNITEGTPGFYPASNANVKIRFTSNTTITCSYTQTGEVAQVETAVVVEDTPGTLTAGNATLTFTSALTGVLTISCALATNDSQNTVATKFRAALNADATFAANFIASGSTNNVVITALVAAANDSTLNLAYADGTSAGLTDDASSNDTTAGVAYATTGKAIFFARITPCF